MAMNEPCSHPVEAWKTAGASHESEKGLASKYIFTVFKWCSLCGALGVVKKDGSGKRVTTWILPQRTQK